MKKGRVSTKDRLIMLRKPSTVSDNGGGRKPASGTDKFIDDRAVWAEFKNPNFRDIVAMGSAVSEANQLIQIWRYDNVCRGWQVKYGDRRLSILNVFNPDRHNTILVCQEVVRG